ncbi:MAG: Crp/Fnr family transcriptional regulator [Actinomycetota bacterium]|nr:Crp/Fnr family transcriptional regulator [Actinomycetota bacterium]
MGDQDPAELEALRRVPFFEELTPDDLARMAKIGERRRYQAGSAIVTKDEAGGGLFVILEGSARVEAGGRVHTLGPGSFFGEMALLSRKPRSATVTAMDSVEVLTLEAMYFRPFLIKNPSVAVTILEGVADRLREVQERVEEIQRAAGTGGG